MTRKINTNVVNMEIIVADELNTIYGGVYRIVFQDKRFYIGIASNLRKRIMGHISNFRTDFSSTGVLKQMKGYKGKIRFELIELCQDVEERFRIEHREICRKSKYRINKNFNRGGTPLKYKYPNWAK
jgi:predicted GIY-YIG superfamily endonuclease